MDRMKNPKSAVAVPPRKAPPAYKNASLPSARRVKDLLSRMTLEEKAAQMMCVWQSKAQTMLDEAGNFDLKKAKKSFRDGRGLGQIGRPSDAGGGKKARSMAELTNAIQKFFLENSRLGIPVMFHEECLHGHAAPDGTSFPQPIALGATFNPALVESLFAMTALEARLRGAHHALTPVVDVAREPRWGRVELSLERRVIGKEQAANLAVRVVGPLGAINDGAALQSHAPAVRLHVYVRLNSSNRH